MSYYSWRLLEFTLGSALRTVGTLDKSHLEQEEKGIQLFRGGCSPEGSKPGVSVTEELLAWKELSSPVRGPAE